MTKKVCRWLKAVGEKAGLGIDLTLYVARHSWTSIAKQRNHSLRTISKALGHSSERTTQIYLASLDNSDVDEANNDILNGLL
ncbi:MAG: tyrosine-type recombinase/integrase [Bacteroidaceae bacterium]|nr:tyrosine-type recombinase/integrase [Bacteroidaceae bacterium]